MGAQGRGHGIERCFSGSHVMPLAIGEIDLRCSGRGKIAPPVVRSYRVIAVQTQRIDSIVGAVVTPADNAAVLISRQRWKYPRGNCVRRTAER